MSILGKPYSIFLKGNLETKEGILKTTLPFPEMRYNLWQISLFEFSYDCVENINILGTISTNFVKDICIKNNAEVTHYPVIGHFALKGNKNEKKTVHLNQNYFYVNNYNQNLELFFRFFLILT